MIFDSGEVIIVSLYVLGFSFIAISFYFAFIYPRFKSKNKEENISIP